VILALVAALVLPEASLAATWRIQRTPHLRLAASLESVSCRSLVFCMAVGSTSGSVSHPLAEQWDGFRWTRMPVPAKPKNAFFSGVSCATDTDCVAVGTMNTNTGYAPLVEHWDGFTWTRQRAARSRSLGSRDDEWFTAVACPTVNRCVAVGSGSHENYVLIERWNGRRWSIQRAPAASPDGSGLTSVACLAADRCVAVGSFQKGSQGDCPVPFVERLSGHRWRIEKSRLPACGNPQDSQLNGVSCPSWFACTAVGYFSAPSDGFDRPIIERSRGTSWRFERTPAVRHLIDPWGGGGYLYDVACPVVRDCIAVGSAGSAIKLVPIIEQWDGARWRLRRVARSVPFGELLGITCLSQTSCVAVGSNEWTGDPLVLRFR
jgi:hypothetical protein